MSIFSLLHLNTYQQIKTWYNGQEGFIKFGMQFFVIRSCAINTPFPNYIYGGAAVAYASLNAFRIYQKQVAQKKPSMEERAEADCLVIAAEKDLYKNARRSILLFIRSKPDLLALCNDHLEKYSAYIAIPKKTKLPDGWDPVNNVFHKKAELIMERDLEKHIITEIRLFIYSSPTVLECYKKHINDAPNLLITKQ